MNIKAGHYQPDESEPNYADALADLWREESLKSPLASQLHDMDVTMLRARAEKRLPSDPSAGRNLFEVILEKAQLPEKPTRQ